mmetsp:Transcript_57531/g.106265  ORF Transcript_57531/g.106265 Transcript_57531/m.106265 type:complete len:949 (+) Transcript_57531:93-2939(+)
MDVPERTGSPRKEARLQSPPVPPIPRFGCALTHVGPLQIPPCQDVESVTVYRPADSKGESACPPISAWPKLQWNAREDGVQEHEPHRIEDSEEELPSTTELPELPEIDNTVITDLRIRCASLESESFTLREQLCEAEELHAQRCKALEEECAAYKQEVLDLRSQVAALADRAEVETLQHTREVEGLRAELAAARAAAASQEQAATPSTSSGDTARSEITEDGAPLEVLPPDTILVKTKFCKVPKEVPREDAEEVRTSARGPSTGLTRSVQQDAVTAPAPQRQPGKQKPLQQLMPTAAEAESDTVDLTARSQAQVCSSGNELVSFPSDSQADVPSSSEEDPPDESSVDPMESCRTVTEPSAWPWNVAIAAATNEPDAMSEASSSSSESNSTSASLQLSASSCYEVPSPLWTGASVRWDPVDREVQATSLQRAADACEIPNLRLPLENFSLNFGREAPRIADTVQVVEGPANSNGGAAQSDDDDGEQPQHMPGELLQGAEESSCTELDHAQPATAEQLPFLEMRVEQPDASAEKPDTMVPVGKAMDAEGWQEEDQCTTGDSEIQPEAPEPDAEPAQQLEHQLSQGQMTSRESLELEAGRLRRKEQEATAKVIWLGECCKELAAALTQETETRKDKCHALHERLQLAGKDLRQKEEEVSEKFTLSETEQRFNAVQVPTPQQKTSPTAQGSGSNTRHMLVWQQQPFDDDSAPNSTRTTTTVQDGREDEASPLLAGGRQMLARSVPAPVTARTFEHLSYTPLCVGREIPSRPAGRSPQRFSTSPSPGHANPAASVGNLSGTLPAAGASLSWSPAATSPPDRRVVTARATTPTPPPSTTLVGGVCRPSSGSSLRAPVGMKPMAGLDTYVAPSRHSSVPGVMQSSSPPRSQMWPGVSLTGAVGPPPSCVVAVPPSRGPGTATPPSLGAQGPSASVQGYAAPTPLPLRWMAMPVKR